MKQTPQTFGPELAKICQPGDLVLYQYGNQGPIQWMIERCHRRMLDDLNAGLEEGDILEFARYTHAGTWIDAKYTAEMTRPHARFCRWDHRLSPGDVVLIRRPCNRLAIGGDPIEIDAATGAKIAELASGDATDKLDYPEREIIRYYAWSWGVRKLLFGERFSALFENDKSDVCSDSYWGYAISAGAWPGIAKPEAIPAGYYPSRLAISRRFVTIARVEIIAGPTKEKGDEE